MKFTFKLDSLLIRGNFNLANTRPRNCCSFFVFIFSSILIHMQTARKKEEVYSRLWRLFSCEHSAACYSSERSTLAWCMSENSTNVYWAVGCRLNGSILIFVSEKEPLQKHTDNPLKSKRMQYGCGTASYWTLKQMCVDRRYQCAAQLWYKWIMHVGTGRKQIH